MKVKIPNYPKGNGHRKINIQIDRWDTYSMDHTLALIILPMLIQLKETKQGVPGEFADVGGADYDPQSSFDFYKETYNDTFDKACDKYDEILDKMIWTFQQIVDDDWESQYHHGEMEIDWVECDEETLNPLTGKMEKLSQMVDKNPNDHWIDMEGLQAHRDRMQEGIDLFAKYYFSLWD